MHRSFYLLHTGRETFLTQATGAFRGDENIVLYPDTAKVVIAFQLGVIDKALAQALFLEFLYGR